MKKSEMTLNRYGVSFKGDKNFWNWMILIISQI